MLPRSDEPYRVIRSDSFHADWDVGVTAGWINPMVHPAQVEYFARSVLPTNPFFGQPVTGAPTNARHIRFPRSPGSADVIEVVYSVVEDDRTVVLDRIYLFV